MSSTYDQVCELRKQGLSQRAIARKLNLSRSTVRWHLDRVDRGLSPDVSRVLSNLGLGNIEGQHSGWVHREDKETGEWASVYYFLGKDGQPEDLGDMLRRVNQEAPPKPAKPKASKPNGDNLLVINIADLHVSRLCTVRETGFDYSGAVATERARVGLDRLLTRAKKFGVARILLILGNDKAHYDTPRRTTTSGTPQDADSTIFEMFRTCAAVDDYAVDACRAVAPVDLIYAPSNHDWVIGFALAQRTQARYRDCPEVSFSDYYASERHRKYYAWAGALLMVTHGDGAKDKDLPALIMAEARDLLPGRETVVVFAAHLHHKVRQRLSPTGAERIEKDFPGLTVIGGRPATSSGEGIEIEVARSPAPPDGWHDRNGYVNRQAVECWMHDETGAQFARFTEWF